MGRPQLERRDANRMSPKSSRRCSRKQRPIEKVVLDPRQMAMNHNLSVLRQFRRRPFVLHSKDVLRGWIRQNEPHHVVPGIVQLVSSYYMDSEAGIFQVGYK